MPFLVDLVNGVSDFQYYYGGKGNFSQGAKVPKVKFNTFDDGFIRAGIGNASLAAARDVVRIGKFFTTTQGFLFAAKQMGLQRSNAQTEPKKTGLLRKLDNNRFYNLGLNTITQTAAQAFGQHIIRHGLLPRINSDERATGPKSYGSVIWNSNKDASNLLITSGSTNRLLEFTSKLWAAKQNEPVQFKKYSGGPDSTYGIGNTIISTAQIFPGIFTTDYNATLSSNSITIPGTFQKYSELNTTANTARDKAKQRSEELIPADYNIKNIEKRLGVSKSKYSLNKKRAVDAINVINILGNSTFYKTSDDATTPNNTLAKDGSFFDPSITKDVDVEGNFGRDIIKFRLEFLNNDEPTTSQGINTEVLAFRAYIDDFNDGMSAKWDAYRYMGRGEEFYIYNGFNRDVSVAFTIYAHSPEEMAPLYNKLNYLMSTFTPDYSSTGKMRGNIGYLTVGDYLYRQPGVFTDIKISGLLDTHWEIALDQPEGGIDAKKQYEIPKMIKVVLSFKPIHTFLPRRNTIKKYTAPFITPDVIAYNRGDNKYLPIKQPVKKTDDEGAVTTANTELSEVIVTSTRSRSNVDVPVNADIITEDVLKGLSPGGF